MKKTSSIFHLIIELSALVLFVLLLSVIFRAANTNKQFASETIEVSVTPNTLESTSFSIINPAHSPYPPPNPKPTPTTGIVLPPFCQFNASASVPTTSISLDSFMFSEPLVTLISDTPIGISSWLPDSQKLLIIRLEPNQSKHVIELFDIQTSKQQSYGESYDFRAISNKPIWSSSAGGVIFADLGFDNQPVLKLSYGADSTPRELAANLLDFSFAADITGNKLVYFFQDDREHPRVYDLTQDRTSSLPIELLSGSQQLNTWENYKVVWKASGDQLIFYNKAGSYLTDITTGKICQLDLGTEGGLKRWAFDYQWNEDGRYLAALTTIGEPVVPFTVLTILDTVTGELRHINLELQYVSAITWAPKSDSLLVLGETSQSQAQGSSYGLFLIEAATGASKRMLPKDEYPLAGSWSIAWSPDGRKVAFSCPLLLPTEPTIIEGRLCLISVEIKQ